MGQANPAGSSIVLGESGGDACRDRGGEIAAFTGDSSLSEWQGVGAFLRAPDSLGHA
jgi:hypothetical protein